MKHREVKWLPRVTQPGSGRDGIETQAVWIHIPSLWPSHLREWMDEWRIFSALSLNMGAVDFVPTAPTPVDFWQSLETFLAVKTWERWVAARDAVKHSILHRTLPSPQTSKNDWDPKCQEHWEVLRNPALNLTNIFHTLPNSCCFVILISHSISQY